MARLAQGLSLSVQQKQSLILTNKMKLSLKVASLPVLELREEILQALEENIALEWKDRKDERVGVERDRLAHSFTSSSQASIEDFIENIPSKQQTLQDDLLFQVGFVKEAESVIEVARTIIQNLDKKGFNIVPIRELMEWSENENLQASSILQADLNRRAVQIVRSLQPLGCACDSIKDYLRFQLYMICKTDTPSLQKKTIIHLAAKLIGRHFSLIKEASYTKAQSVLSQNGLAYTLQQIKDAIHLIGELQPYPAYKYSEEGASPYIVPDVFIRKEKEELVIIANNDVLPRIRISKEIEELAEEKSEVGKFAKERVQQARDLISSIKERENTLIKVIASIIVFQREFFYYGVKYLSPLRQKDIAEELHLATSTISRVLANKYLACEWGIFPISYFFSQKATTSQSSAMLPLQSNYVASGYSKQACKEIIRNICETNPNISDSKIATLLEKKGIKLSRRTITKYRNEMGIKVSHKR